MKSDRFTPLTKPRTITRDNDASMDQISQSVVYQGVREFDLEQGDVFSFDALRPIETRQYLNLEAYPHAFEEDYDVLCWATALLSESPLAMAFMKEAEEAGWHLALSDLGTGGFHIDTATKTIELDHYGLDARSLGASAFFRHDLILVLAKALRDVWHEERWGAFEEDYRAESVVMLERARAADTDSISILVGWELRAAGYSDIWRHILGSDDSDMAKVLTNILERYPTALYNGMALAHVFRQWYADTARVDALDHSTLEHMDYVIREAQEKAQKFGEKSADAQDFEQISVLPDGTIYLKELGDTVARDPFFNGLEDSINQAHLFQIVYDSKVTYVAGIPFRDEKLARKFLLAD